MEGKARILASGDNLENREAQLCLAHAWGNPADEIERAYTGGEKERSRRGFSSPVHGRGVARSATEGNALSITRMRFQRVLQAAMKPKI